MNHMFSDNIHSLAKKAVEVISREIKRILEEKDEVVIGICGGRSVRSIFDALPTASIPWAKVHIFWVDERIVPHDDPSSNYRLAKETFLHLLPAKNIHPAKKSGYIDQLMRLGGFDIVILSSGADGHVASLFPHHHALYHEERTFITIDDSPLPPDRRVTATKTLLHDAETALLLFYGEEKRSALKNFATATVDDCPATLAKEIKNLYIFTDII